MKRIAAKKSKAPIPGSGIRYVRLPESTWDFWSGRGSHPLSPSGPRRFRVVSRQFGYPMFAADLPHNVNVRRGRAYEQTPPFSDRPHDAFVYTVGEDNPAIKLAYWRGVAARYGLESSALQVEELA